MKHLTLAAVLSLTCASAFAGQACTDAPKNTWMSKEQITTQVKGMGYTIKKLDVEDKCYEVKGLDKDGKKVEAYFNPVDGKLVKTK